MPAHGSGGARATINLIARTKNFRPEARTARQEGVWGRNAEPSERRSPAAPPEYLEGGTEQKFPFPFQNFFQGARKRKIVRENFCEVAAGALAEAGGGARAYDFVSSHHALRAWELSDILAKIRSSVVV